MLKIGLVEWVKGVKIHDVIIYMLGMFWTLEVPDINFNLWGKLSIWPWTPEGISTKGVKVHNVIIVFDGDVEESGCSFLLTVFITYWTFWDIIDGLI